MKRKSKEKDLLSIKDFLKHVPYCDRHVRRLIHNHKLKALKLQGGRKWLIPRTEIENYRERIEKGEKLISLNNFEKLKTKHFYQLSSVAKTIFSGGLRGIKRTKEGSYEYDRFDDGYGGIGSFTMDYQEIITQLHQNIEKAYDKHRNYDLFEYFLIHLTSSIPGFPNLDKADLHKLADASPLELIEALKMLALKKDFKGKCPICKDWE